MILGPFNVRELEPLKQIFESKGVPVEISIDKDLEAQTLKEFNERATYNPRVMGGHLDLRIVFFEIDERHYDLVKNDLEKFGIVADLNSI